MEEPAKEKPELGSVTEGGLPLAMRGGLRLEAARLTGDEDLSFGTLDVVAQFPLAERVFFDARLPLTIGSLGNPMLGARGILRPSDGVWITLGGAAGIPLIGDDDDLVIAGGTTQAFWNLHQYSAETLPLQIITGIEGHVGEVAIFRAQLEPVLHLTFGDRARDPMELALQYAVEAQFGHTTGGGLRFQGVWLATSGESENHQLAIEPFFILERERLFLRLGLLLPLTDPIGSIFDSNYPDPWGVRAATGLHFD